ncbi:FKBP-type peptidyl-prolyl cis-trans isomerase [Alloscardovia theropitheci]|uniref:peptidylprolyl isomerase n=1 Tax=Alloscardovia theropitheci TaxID=2496842 RepID=A0A4R0QSH5_9BIFI|nr:FKBP-type peptidyl-prolyl cis-trans isomerase [Alloscardovia theropitheci]TCD54085.1 FKBP-type peptidyl-prolyl cis-trans isomerase [Alloscardovia theropitheci]
MQFNSRNILRSVAAVIASATLLISAGACGSSQSSSSSDGITFSQMTGVSAKGKLGEKPTITFKTPFEVKNNSYQVVQKGDGASFKDGQKLCIQQIVFDPKTGKEVNSTWESQPDCTATFSQQSMQASFYNLFKTLKINSTVVMGITSNNSSDSQTAQNSQQSSEAVTAYLMALTIVSAQTIPTKAEGKKVDNIDSSLPKITLAKNGEPSINANDLKNYKSDGSLKVQTLIEGNGNTLTENSTVTVQYTGWVLGGDAAKPFDSSWSRGTPATFNLQQVVKGWTQGLTGQKVGSQVLIIIPPDLGYGSTAQNNIPANSTLVFVVDILAAQ